MKAAIVYKSKTGNTGRYARWIQESTGFDLVPFERVSLSHLAACDFIIFGSRVHAGRVEGLKKITSFLPDRQKTRLVVFATGATPAGAEEAIDSIWKASFSEEERKTIPHFYLPGGLNYEKMGIMDWLIMKSLAAILSCKRIKSAAEAGCQQAIRRSYDLSGREAIRPLLLCVQNLMGGSVQVPDREECSIE